MGIRRMMKKMKIRYRKTRTVIAEKKNIRRKKALYQSVTLTPEQKAEIHAIWKKHYGKKYSLKWHRLYQSYFHNSIGGGFNALYFPEILYAAKLRDILNPPFLTNALSDKSLTELFFAGCDEVKIPETILLNGSGYFYNGNREVISRSQAEKILKNAGKIVAKPSIGSSSGKRVLFFDFGSDRPAPSSGPQTPRELIDFYKDNFIVQKQIVQHPIPGKLHESSINTIRVHTYVLEDKVYSTAVALRMGRGQKRVDNASQGGLAVGVSDDGLLSKVAFTVRQEIFYQHPDSGVTFEGYRLPKIKEIVETAKKLHGRIPHIGLIAWDMALDADENIVVIECNINYPSLWFPQYATGKAFFGENTTKMLELCRTGKVRY